MGVKVIKYQKDITLRRDISSSTRQLATFIASQNPETPEKAINKGAECDLNSNG